MKEHTIKIEYKDGTVDEFNTFLKSLDDFEVGIEVLARTIRTGKFSCDISSVTTN